jgi:hypothetical protein
VATPRLWHPDASHKTGVTPTNSFEAHRTNWPTRRIFNKRELADRLWLGLYGPIQIELGGPQDRADSL